MKKLFHSIIVTTLEFVYPYADGTKREKLTPWEWFIGILIFSAFLVVAVSWALRW
jgi:hypothetical protein